jgi:hypothetical protein
VALRLYLDDCAFSHELRTLLLAAGHHVVVPSDAGLTGEYDERHFEYAVRNLLILVTKNPGDFCLLHEDFQARSQDHPGIFAVYQDNDITRDMSDREIVRVIGNAEATYQSASIPFTNQFVSLNAFRW